jgi:HK97 family phage prohead protease
MEQATINLPLVTRRATLESQRSYNDDDLSFEAVIATESKALRLNWDIGQFYERIILDDTLSLDRVKSGAAPLLYEHSEHIGIIEDAWIENRSLVAKLRMSKSDKGRQVYSELKDGTLRKFSIGYTVGKLTLEERDAKTGVDVYRASNLTLYEATVTAMPADPATGVRSAEAISVPCIIESELKVKEQSMPETEMRAADTPKVDTDTLIRAETERVQYLYRMQATHNVDASVIDDLVARRTPISECAKIILDSLQVRQEEAPIPRATQVEMTRDASEKLVDAATVALIRRYAPQAKLKAESGNPYQGYTIRQVMEEFVEARGVKTRGVNPNQIYRRAQGLQDFTVLQENFASRLLLESYQSTIRTFDPFTVRRPIGNFSENLRARPSRAPVLQRVGDDGTVAKGTLSIEEIEKYKLASYSTWMTLTRQALISDDLGQFTSDVWEFGQQAGLLESQLVYSQLINNPNLGDNKPLFSTERKNIGGGAGLDIAGLSAARQALRQQTNAQGDRINLEMGVVIVGSALETIAEKLLTPTVVETNASDVNVFKGRFTLVVDSIMDANEDVWFACVPRERYPIVELGYLDGQEGPYILSDTTIDVDGTAFRYGIDVAAKILDFRGIWASKIPTNKINDPSVSARRSRGSADDEDSTAVRRRRGE